MEKITQESKKTQKLREKQEEIVMLKLQKEDEIRKRNEDIKKKWEKVQRMER